MLVIIGLVYNMNLRVSPGSRRTADLSDSKESGLQLHTSHVTLDKTPHLAEHSLASVQWKQDLPAHSNGFREGQKRSLMCKYFVSAECMHEGTETSGQVQCTPAFGKHLGYYSRGKAEQTCIFFCGLLHTLGRNV